MISGPGVLRHKLGLQAGDWVYNEVDRVFHHVNGSPGGGDERGIGKGNDMIQRRKILIFLMIACLVFMMTGCGNRSGNDGGESAEAGQESGQDAGEKAEGGAVLKDEAGTEYSLTDFAGRWNCGDSTLEDDFMYSGYLVLDINEDGSFRTVDIGAGNPGIKGIAKVLDDKTISVDCSNDEDFDPFWYDMEPVAEIGYKIVDQDNIQFSFTSDGKLSTLTFSRGTAEEEDEVDWAEDDGEEGDWDDEDESDT